MRETESDLFTALNIDAAGSLYLAVDQQLYFDSGNQFGSTIGHFYLKRDGQIGADQS